LEKFSNIKKNESFYNIKPWRSWPCCIKTRSPNVAVEIGKDFQLMFELDEMFGRYAISLRKLKLEEQLFFAVEVNIVHISRLTHWFNVIIKHIKNNGLTHLMKKVWKCILFYYYISGSKKCSIIIVLFLVLWFFGRYLVDCLIFSLSREQIAAESVHFQ